LIQRFRVEERGSTNRLVGVPL